MLRRSLLLLLFIAALFGLWSLRTTLFLPLAAWLPAGALRADYVLLTKVVVWGGLAFVYTRWVLREASLRYLGVASWPSAAVWGKALVIVVLYLAALAAFELIVGGRSLRGGALYAIATVHGLLLFVVVPFVEELLFRGLILKELDTLMPGPLANLLSALLFAAIQWPHWLWTRIPDQALLIGSLDTLLLGLVAGHLYLKSRSLWPAVLVHGAHAILIASLAR